LVENKSSCPSLGRTEYIGVGESAAKDYHAYVVKSFAAALKVRHGHILNVKSCQPEGIGHFAFTIGSLLTDYGGFHTGCRPAVRVQTVLSCLAGKVIIELEV
jgi:hypothetical protein